MKYFEIRAFNRDGRVIATRKLEKLAHATYVAGLLRERYEYAIAKFEIWHCAGGSATMCAVGKEGRDEGFFTFCDNGARVH